MFEIVDDDHVRRRPPEHGYTIIVRSMDFKQGLDRTKNTPIVRKAKLGIKLKVIMSSFISWLSSGQKSVASYCKMGR